ncbi:putative T7SS-secreted protein [Streptomyces sp. NPDC001339]|uniref:putative T7SS-secreted protein n=1 Tax=Streptomyces sp. NPDC001339 TaxID=3364563 RepID=UPI003688589E
MAGGTIPPDAAGFPGLGFDPAPGQPAAIRSLVDTVFDGHRKLQSVWQTLNSLTHSGEEWSGVAADAFSARVQDLPKLVDAATGSFYDCAFQLNEWSGNLDTMRSQAQDLERQAVAKRARVRSAEENPDLRLAGQTFDTDAELERAQQRLNTAVHDLDAARDALKSVIEQACRLQHQHDELAEKTATAIRRAAEGAPDEPGLLDKLAGAVQSLAEAHAMLANEVWDWVKDHSKNIAAVGDVLAAASTAVGVAGFGLVVAGAGIATVFPPAGAAVAAVGEGLETVSGGLALGALAFHGVARLAGNKDVTNRTLIEDTLGTLSFATGGASHLASGRTLRMIENAGRLMGRGSAGSGAEGMSENPSALGNFVPKDTRQAIEAAVIPGGALFVGLENAWQSGYDS